MINVYVHRIDITFLQRSKHILGPDKSPARKQLRSVVPRPVRVGWRPDVLPFSQRKRVVRGSGRRGSVERIHRGQRKRVQLQFRFCAGRRAVVSRMCRAFVPHRTSHIPTDGSRTSRRRR